MRDWPQAQPRPRYRRAIFLDRDGTINVDTHYPHQVELLDFYPRSLRGLALMARFPLDIIVVSNQAGIDLGRFTTRDMSQFNAEIRTRVEQREGRIDAFYYCPHRERKDLRPGETLCLCSKPAPGMLLEAARDFEIDLTKSFCIGDKTSDIVAGQAVKCLTILVNTGKAGQEEGSRPVKATYEASDLVDAALFIHDRLYDEAHASRYTSLSLPGR